MSSHCTSCSAPLHDDADRCDRCGAAAFEEIVGRIVVGGQYRVTRRLGSGGYGTVYEVETVVGGLRRAMKVLSRQWVDDVDTQERFVNEALVLEQINHPHVARCYAAGTLDDGQLYLLLELVDGVQLSTMTASEPLEPSRAVRLAKQIAAGLEAAHGANVLHRDLKPENILVHEPGTPREHVKVIDFGIAKLVERGSTSTRTVVGTPDFMAPEQFQPGTPLDFRVDLWSLGALLFTLLTGRTPYRSETGGVAAIIAQQQQRVGLGPAPSEVLPALRSHRGLDQLVSRLLATRPADRPGSAAEVCEELGRLEHSLAYGSARGGSEALLGALCATPSESSWLALHGYLASQSDRRDELVKSAERLLASWPSELRRAPLTSWEASKRGQLHPLWSLVRTLDISARGLDDDEVARIAQNPALATITKLDLSHNEIGNAGVEALARSPYLRQLEHLDLSHNRVSSSGLDALARGQAMRELRTLRMAHNGIGARGAEALAASPLRLHEIDLSGNDLGAQGAAAIADAASFAGLVALRLSANRIGPDGIAALAVSKHLSRLRVLEVDHNGLGPSGAAAIALSANFRQLRTLRIARNGLGREGLQLLLSSTSLDDLQALDVAGNGVGASGAMLLASTPFVRRLQHLDVGDAALGDAGLAALLGSPHLGGLRSIGLAQNDITVSGATLLASAPPQLEELDLSLNPLGDAAADAIAEALTRLRITRLRVSGSGLGAQGVAGLLRAGRLEEIDASRNALGSEGVDALVRTPGAASLRALDLSQCALGRDGLRALATANELTMLRALDLSSNDVGDVGVTLLVAGAPKLARLESLALADDGLGPDAAEALAASSLALHLRALRLAHNQLGDRGAEALARGPSWHALRVLDVKDNGITLAGAAAIWGSASMSMVERIELSSNVLASDLDVHSLSIDKVDRMEASFAKISALGADFAERFYDELFARNPRVRPLFARVSMSIQYQHLMNALTMVIDNLRDPDRIERTLVELGDRHLRYQVVPTHYYAMVSTLLDCIRDALGDTWDDELQSAWTEGLQAVTNVMMRSTRGHVGEATEPNARPGFPRD
jgi:serine/threonine protein kinase/Ran GTPase-activating protein (RanGAP) involved in mRNA processing and transport/hemoglobin-like flavoprotein